MAQAAPKSNTFDVGVEDKRQPSATRQSLLELSCAIEMILLCGFKKSTISDVDVKSRGRLTMNC